jgi:hypothetical protein
LGVVAAQGGKLEGLVVNQQQHAVVGREQGTEAGFRIFRFHAYLDLSNQILSSNEMACLPGLYAVVELGHAFWETALGANSPPLVDELVEDERSQVGVLTGNNREPGEDSRPFAAGTRAEVMILC